MSSAAKQDVEDIVSITGTAILIGLIASMRSRLMVQASEIAALMKSQPAKDRLEANKQRFQDDTDDYVSDPRYRSEVSRFGLARPPLKRETITVQFGMRDDKTRYEAQRIKDHLDRMRAEGDITEESYQSARLFQSEFENCGYTRCRTTNLEGTSGGNIGIEDILARSMKSRDYVHHVIHMLGGPGTKASIAVVQFVGLGLNYKAIAEAEGKGRHYWSGTLEAALAIMGADYHRMLRGHPRHAVMVADRMEEHIVPDQGYVISPK